MRPVMIAAVALIALGIAALAWPTLTFSDRELVVDVGPVEVTTETERTVTIPVVAGILAIAGGVALIVVKRPRSA